MRMQFFAIPAHGDTAATESLNAFLARHRVSGMRRHFVADGAQSYWAICVTYVDSEPRAAPLPGKGRLDYREVLSPPDFAIYARLRDVRKRLAADAGVPPYHVLTNEQLAAIVQQRLTSRDALAQLDGFGPARMAKFGPPLLDALTAAFG